MHIEKEAKRYTCIKKERKRGEEEEKEGKRKKRGREKRV